MGLMILVVSMVREKAFGKGKRKQDEMRETKRADFVWDWLSVGIWKDEG